MSLRCEKHRRQLSPTMEVGTINNLEPSCSSLDKFACHCKPTLAGICSTLLCKVSLHQFGMFHPEDLNPITRLIIIWLVCMHLIDLSNYLSSLGSLYFLLALVLWSKTEVPVTKQTSTCLIGLCGCDLPGHLAHFQRHLHKYFLWALYPTDTWD